MSGLNKFEKIEQYLNGELSGKDLTDFENQISNDTKLAQEVDFQRNIESILAHQPEDDLRANLKKLNAKHTKSSNGFLRFIAFGIGFLLIVIAIGWWMRKAENQTGISISDEPKKELAPLQNEESQEEVTPIPPKKTENIEEKTPEPSPMTEPQKSKEPNIKNTPTEQKKPIPIAANFEPNEYLESRLGNLRSDELNVETPKSNFSLKNGKINFSLKGVFNSDDNMEERELTLYIFSNKMEDYENFKPTFSKVLEFKTMENAFQFDLNEDISLTEGLYYFQIEDENGEVFLLNKFTVK